MSHTIWQAGEIIRVLSEFAGVMVQNKAVNHPRAYQSFAESFAEGHAQGSAGNS